MFSLVRSVLLLSLASACSDANLPGHRFEVVLQPVDDGCTDGQGQGEERYTYRVEADGASIGIFVGQDLLANGSLSGCNVRYTSVPWTESRRRGEVRWRISGEAVIALGDGCAAEQGWRGTEVIEVLESTDPGVPGGCRYRYEVTGSYGGFVGD